MVKLQQFKIFNEIAVGRIFMPDGLSYEKSKVIIPSPHHGRSQAVKVDDFKWILVKGGGWNYQGPQIYASAKDSELIFGLYDLSSAKREIAVSKLIEKFIKTFPKVLYYKRFCDYKLPKRYDFLRNIKFTNGKIVDPCLLYTEVKCPYRVADLMYFTDRKKRSVIEAFSRYWNIQPADYIDRFIEELAKNVAIMHKNGFINDTLEYGNVTLLAEIVDYEWVTAPGILLPDGTRGLVICDERREKELLYGAEICLRLMALIHKPYNLFDIYEKFVRAYAEINEEFILNNTNVKKILERRKIII